jgi:hypothetical protein
MQWLEIFKDKGELKARFIDELTEHAGNFLSESMVGLTTFCFWAILYRFNIQMEPQYRGLFRADG